MYIVNYTYNEFLELADAEQVELTILAVRYVEEFNKPADVLNIGPFVNLSFGFVKDVQHAFNSDEMDFAKFIELLKQAGIENVGELPIFDLRREMLYFAKQIELINTAERSLVGSPTFEEMAADATAISKMGAFVQFSELAGGDVSKIESVKAAQYGICFAELKLRHERSEYSKRLTKIIQKKR